MHVIKEGQSEPEEREIYELHIFPGAKTAENMKFTIGVNGLESMGLANGVVNLIYEDDDMHSIFISGTDMVYTKHRKVKTPLILVPDMAVPKNVVEFSGETGAS